jgi:phage FluMu protein Com
MRNKVTEGDASEVTCKRCKKLLERADENGHVILK